MKKRILMLLRQVLATLAVGVCSPIGAFAHTLPISESDWASIPDLRTMDENTAIDTATNLLKSAANAETDSLKAFRLRVMSFVLARRFLPDCEPEEDRCISIQASLSKLKSGIISDANGKEMIDRSSAALDSIIGRRPAKIPYRIGVRVPTAAERRILTEAVKKELIDPTAPIFGPAHLVENQACMTINSKNQLGGYTGNQEAMIFRVSGEWRMGGTMRVSHDECIATLRHN